MKVSIGVSNRHVHLTQEDYKKLFCKTTIEKRNDLSQSQEFASTDIVTLKTSKDKIENVRVLGPFRPYTQVEISVTDCYKLGIEAKVKESGDVKDAKEITIEGSAGTITKKAVIIANRHIHISPEEVKKYNLNPQQKYKIKVNNEKGGILNNIILKVDKNFKMELHLDTDDANALLLKQGDEVELVE